MFSDIQVEAGKKKEKHFGKSNNNIIKYNNQRVNENENPLNKKKIQPLYIIL